jgi:cation diffusion facilitator CzcD-associated flavoprotein CzcO
VLSEDVDVLIIGAGLSGIGAARHLTAAFPGSTYVLLESRDTIGGTWDLFRYPGVRSDSDMITLGYSFKPWTDPVTMADGPSILRYVQEAAEEAGIDRHIRFRHRVTSMDWSSDEGRWTVVAERTDTGEVVTYRAGWVMSCTGYYRYDEGFTPEFEGRDDFRGQIVHPQHWPEDLDYAGKRVVVIGSGATAVTLVPAMADDAAHVTMLQRTPTYVVSLPDRDPFMMSRLGQRLPKRLVYRITRAKNITQHVATYQLSQRQPALVRRLIRAATRKQLPEGFEVDLHFRPPYDPWDQRLCVVPRGDLFRVLRNGEASVVTDRIACFDATGIQLESGRHVEADVIVTATGLNLLPLGGMTLRVDGKEVALPDTMAYRGLMLSGVPNFAMVVGYTNASWTLKADLVCEFVVRVLRHMSETDQRVCVPVREPGLEEEPFLDFAAGYVLRSLHQFPHQGSRAPWKLRQNYFRDAVSLRRGELDDGALQFGNPPGPLRAGTELHTKELTPGAR